MARDHDRERSPRPHSTSSRNYRDRRDPPQKRKDRDASEDALPSKKKVHLSRTESNEYPSVNELKRRIRDVKRLLGRVDLAADARIVQERALAGYERDLEDETKRRDRSQMIKKYHFVRFLERKSATKDLNRLLRREKELTKSDSASEETPKSLTQKIHIARVNLNYTIYYPLTEKYISLYAEKKPEKKPSSEESQDEEAQQDAGKPSPLSEDGEKPAMWHVIEKSMADGTLDRLRDGKLKTGLIETNNASAAPSKADKTKKSKDTARDNKKSASHEKKKIPEKNDISKQDEQKNRRERRREEAKMREAQRLASINNGDDSDGGFFEE